MNGIQASATPVLLFRARARLCAVPIERLVEIMRPLPAAPFPAAPAFVLGAARIRGAAVPVVDLGALLDCTEPSRPSRFLIVRLGGDRRVALAVEGVAGLRDLGPDVFAELPPLLTSADQDAVAAIGTLDGELLIALETTRLVPETVWPTLDAGGPA